MVVRNLYDGQRRTVGVGKLSDVDVAVGIDTKISIDDLG
jgi:hypothetical protein